MLPLKSFCAGPTTRTEREGVGGARGRYFVAFGGCIPFSRSQFLHYGVPGGAVACKHVRARQLAYRGDASFSLCICLETGVHYSVHVVTSVCHQREQGKMSEGSATFRLYISTVLAVARENLDSASSCDDSAWRNAKAILAVIPDGEDDAEGSDDEDGEGTEERNARREAHAAWRADVENERNLMEAVQMLTELKVCQDVVIRGTTADPGLMRVNW